MNDARLEIAQLTWNSRGVLRNRIFGSPVDYCCPITSRPGHIRLGNSGMRIASPHPRQVRNARGIQCPIGNTCAISTSQRQLSHRIPVTPQLSQGGCILTGGGGNYVYCGVSPRSLPLQIGNKTRTRGGIIPKAINPLPGNRDCGVADRISCSRTILNDSDIGSEWIKEIERVISGIGVKIDSTIKADRILADEATHSRIIKSGPVVIKTGTVIFAPGILIGTRTQRPRYRGSTERLISILSPDHLIGLANSRFRTVVHGLVSAQIV